MYNLDTVSKERIRKFEKILGNHVVGLDIDQVLLSSIDPVIHQVSKDFETDFSLRDFRGWNSVRDFAVQKLGWTKDRAEEYDEWVWTAPEVIGLAKPMPGAQEFTKRLSQFGIEFYAITSRIPSLRKTTHEAFEEHFPWIDSSQIKINEDQGLIGHNFKYLTVDSLGVSLHIDDSPAHCELILRHTDAACVLISNYDGADSLNDDRLAKISANGRLPNLRDFHKKVLFEPSFIPSHNIDRS